MTDTRTPAGRRYMTVKAQNRLIDSQTRSPPLPHVIVPEIGEVLIEPPSSPPPPPQNASSDLLHQIQDFIPLTFPNRKDALSIISTILTAVSHHRSTSKQDVTWSSHLPKLTQDDPTAPSPITMSDLAEHQQTTRHLPQFEIPATKAPQLPSNLFDLDMDDRQQVIEDYLYECEEKARFLGFRRDHHEPATFWNQPTAVDWVTLELSGEMRVRWRGVPADQRRTMSWEGFKEWVQVTFNYAWVVQNVWKPLPVEEKKEPEPFISPHATEIPTPTIPSGWHLIAEPLTPALAQPLPITSTQENERDEEKREQDEQEEEEDIFSDSSSTISSHSSHSASIFDELSLPTRLDYPRGHRTPRLTPSERAEYIRNGWCVYCRSKDHVIDACTVGGRRHGRGPLSADERKRYYARGWCSFCREKTHVVSECVVREREGKMGGDAVRNGDGRVLNGKGSEASLRSDGGVVVNTALPPRPTLTARPRSGPLTDEERRMYYKKGWCTYCRAEDHIIADCQLAARPGKTSVKGSVHVAAMPIHAKACVGYGSYLHTVGSCNVFLSKRGTT